MTDDRGGLHKPGREVAALATPAEARARLLHVHTWETRLPEMLNRAG